MSHITLRVLDGTDRGKVFKAVDVPVTIGREEGNTIQLNDERISRFHLRIQQDHDDLVLTDLESTNGSKVNNEDVQLRILRHGDLITVGRSTLLFGARKEINAHLEQSGPKSAQQGQVGSEDKKSDVVIANKDWQKDSKLLLDYDPPHLPDRLSPGQAAQLTEVLEFLHGHVRQVITEADLEKRKHNRQVVLDADHWQRLLDAQAYLSEYMRRISDPLE
jgi:pSer/pThr/pTyr-binding forkhead associated (FHA) protein